jgi:hypothetical protein
MRRINTSTAALAMSALALFLALGGTAVAVSQIGTSQIRNGAVTKAKLHRGAVANSKLAPGAVTGSKLAPGAVTSSSLAPGAVTSSSLAAGAVTSSSIAPGAVGTSQLANSSVTSAKVADGSLTASDVAPNTFLAADGTAADSDRLGGLLPADYLQGVGIMEDRRVTVAENGSSQFLSAGFGNLTASCGGTGQLTATWTPSVSDAEFGATVTVFGQSPTIEDLNAIGAGVPESDPSAATAPFSAIYQIGFTDAQGDHVATLFVNGRFESGTGCVFIGQELSSG